MDEPLVRLDLPVASAGSDGRATITLDSPHNRNALSRRLLSELAAALDAAVEHPATRVIVLTGAGPVFCSGADLKEQRAAAEPGGAAAGVGGLPAILTKLWSCPQPVICRLNGLARAGGVGLFSACDLVVAPTGVSFSFTEVRLGLVPAIIAVPVLRRVATQAVHRLFLTGEVMDTYAAQEIGLVDEVGPEFELDATVDRLIGMLVRGGPEALALTKQLRAVASQTPEEAFAWLEPMSASRFASAEGREGMSARIEKRDPAWIPDRYRSA